MVAIGRLRDAFAEKGESDHRECDHAPRDVGAHQGAEQNRHHHQRRHGAEDHGQAGILGKLDVAKPWPQDLHHDDREHHQHEAGNDAALVERDRDENRTEGQYLKPQREARQSDDDGGGGNQKQVDDVIALLKGDVVQRQQPIQLVTERRRASQPVGVDPGQRQDPQSDREQRQYGEDDQDRQFGAGQAPSLAHRRCEPGRRTVSDRAAHAHFASARFTAVDFAAVVFAPVL